MIRLMLLRLLDESHKAAATVAAAVAAGAGAAVASAILEGDLLLLFHLVQSSFRRWTELRRQLFLVRRRYLPMMLNLLLLL